MGLPEKWGKILLSKTDRRLPENYFEDAKEINNWDKFP